MLLSLVKLLTNTPFYPHWLDFRNEQRGTAELIQLLSGKVLETGAGNCVKKERALRLNPRIRKYVATDYSDWDELFVKQTKYITAFGKVTELLFGQAKDAKKIDKVCDAMDLPFKDNTFDAYWSSEVLEHIHDPLKFFKEASRVLKKGGICITTMPFLYREHGGTEYDFQRFTRGGYSKLARQTGMEVERVFSYCCFGTTMASMTNQYVIRKIMEGNLLVKVVVGVVAPFIFFATNTIGFVIDSLDRDDRFAERYHVVMRKKKMKTKIA